MRAAAIHDRHFGIETYYDEIDITDYRVLWLAIIKVVQFSNRNFAHDLGCSCLHRWTTSIPIKRAAVSKVKKFGKGEKVRTYRINVALFPIGASKPAPHASAT
jgi:hypothetical protein